MTPIEDAVTPVIPMVIMEKISSCCDGNQCTKRIHVPAHGSNAYKSSIGFSSVVSDDFAAWASTTRANSN